MKPRLSQIGSDPGFSGPAFAKTSAGGLLTGRILLLFSLICLPKLATAQSDLSVSNSSTGAAQLSLSLKAKTETGARKDLGLPSRPDSGSARSDLSLSNSRSGGEIHGAKDMRTSAPQVRQISDEVKKAMGGGTDGGANALVCGAGFFFWQPDGTVYLADTYKLFLQNKMPPQMMNLPEKVYLDSISQILNQQEAGLGDVVLERLSLLRFIPTGKLSLLGDDHINVQGTDCVKKQLAVQDIPTGDVRYDKKLYDKLSAPERAYVKIHEALISLKKKDNDTTPIRQELLAAAEKVILSGVMQELIDHSYVEIPVSQKIFAAMNFFNLYDHGEFGQNFCRKISPESESLAHDRRYAYACLHAMIDNPSEFWGYRLHLQYGPDGTSGIMRELYSLGLLKTFGMYYGKQLSQNKDSRFAFVYLHHYPPVDIAIEAAPYYDGEGQFLEIATLTKQTVSEMEKLTDFFVHELTEKMNQEDKVQYGPVISNLQSDMIRFKTVACKSRPDLCHP